MPSPFPGMDPFIESQEWSDFQPVAIATFAEILNPRLGPRYVARIERRVYVEHPDEPESDFVVPDVTIVGRSGGSGPAAAVDTVAIPVVCLMAMPEERRESYLLIKDLDAGTVVTVIELLSPSNKRRGTGRKKYLSKREEVLGSKTHLVEFDLLRGGVRLPMGSALPPGDSYAIVSRAPRRPRADVYAWRLKDRLPTVPVPLAQGDPDVAIDLQQVFETVYDRAKYDLTLNYTLPLVPPVGEATARWVSAMTSTRQGRKAEPGIESSRAERSP